MGKYKGKPAGAIEVKGKTAAGDFVRRIKASEGLATPDNSALRLLWARKRLQRLSDTARLAKEDPRVQEITALGLKYGLMTGYTSFVAVDKVKRGDGQVVTVKQPLPLPEGVSDLAVGGGVMQKARMAAPPGSYASAAVDAVKEAPALPIRQGEGDKRGKLTVTGQVTEVKGELNVDRVKAALEQELGRITACCAAAQARGLTLPQEIPLRFTIGPDGKVIKTRVVFLPVKYLKLSECLREIVLNFAFPAPGKGEVQVKVKLLIKEGAPSK
jgi:Ca-activated chloride channel family protein